MAYCRWIDGGQVYMYSSMDSDIRCCECLLYGNDPGRTRFKTYSAAIEHLEEHRTEGPKFHRQAIGRLKRDAVAEGVVPGWDGLASLF